jgi:hypothetical protein
MSKMDDLAKEIINTPVDIKSHEFQDVYLDHQIKSVGLVFCSSCQKFVDDEQHIHHIFAYNAKEIREKSILERMTGRILP